MWVGIIERALMVFSEDLLGHFPRSEGSSPCSFMTQAHKLSKGMSVVSDILTFPLFLANVCPNTKEVYLFFVTLKIFSLLNNNHLFII